MSDLESFFSEINQLDEAAAPAETKPKVEEAVAPQVISKAPAVIVRKAEVKSDVHDVHTYKTHESSQAPITSSHTAATSSQQKTAAAPPPPPSNLPLSNDHSATAAATQAPAVTSTTYSGFSFAPSAVSISKPAPPLVPKQNKKYVRKAADDTWVDDTLNEWPDNDYRIFVGDLAKEIGTDHLARHFQMYKSFAKAKVIRTKHENKARGYGFVSFLDPMDCAKAIREQNGKYLGTRPMKISKSTWKDRDIKEVKKKETKKRKIAESLGLA